MQLKGARSFGDDVILTISISDKELRLISDIIFEKCRTLSAMQSILTDSDKTLYKALKVVYGGIERCLKSL